MRWAELPDHVVLRYGTLYGPGTWYARNAPMATKLRAGEVAANDAANSFTQGECRSLHLEVCVFSYLAAELRSGDIAAAGARRPCGRRRDRNLANQTNPVTRRHARPGGDEFCCTAPSELVNGTRRTLHPKRSSLSP